MTERLARLIERARAAGPPTPEERHAQRISFAYGNGHLEDPRIIREVVERAAAAIAAEKSAT